MDDIDVDEKKPFDHDAVKEEEDKEPDPDETLMMDQGHGRVWSVKIPKHLMEKWSAVQQEDVHLATIRVYDRDKHSNAKQRIILLIPPEPSTDPTSTPPEPEEYELDMVNDVVENQLVVAEREKEPNSRARTTILTGRIKHDCNIRPSFTEGYRKRMRERHRIANTPKRQIRLIDEVVQGRGAINMLSSGIGRDSPSSSGFSHLARPKPAKGTFERYARIPRNQLLDMLFVLYRERPRWSAKELRTRTEQPEAYLKDVLGEIADLHRSGEFNGLYELKPNFSEAVKRDSEGPDVTLLSSQGQSSTLPTIKMDEDDEDDDDDDDDDDDMEEVS